MLNIILEPVLKVLSDFVLVSEVVLSGEAPYDRSHHTDSLSLVVFHDPVVSLEVLIFLSEGLVCVDYELLN